MHVEEKREREHTHSIPTRVIIGSSQTFNPKQKDKVESWHLFFSNRAGQACVIDAWQTMHVSRGRGLGARGWLPDERRFAFIIFYCQRICPIFDGGGSDVWRKLTSRSTWLEIWVETDASRCVCAQDAVIFIGGAVALVYLPALWALWFLYNKAWIISK